jgi:uncharacterized protein (DUF1501 family)
MLSALAQLRMIGAVAGTASGNLPAGGAAGDYKALVCLFLAGGNDANNMLIPSDPAGYAAYAAARSTLAIPRTGLLAVDSRATDGRSFGFHPSLGDLHGLFSDGRAALLANVGTLAAPTTKAQFISRSVPLPRQLFSHNDQQVQWQSSLPDRMFASGWGGRLADLTNAFNEKNDISMSISLAGQNAFQVGRTVTQYAVSPNGVVQPANAGGVMGAMRFRAQTDLLKSEDDNLFDAAFSGMTLNAIADSARLASILRKETPLKTEFPKGSLGNQLRMIARLIAVAPDLGLRRQIFFARIGGWDLHNGQLPAHARLFSDLGQCIAAFHRATVEIGVPEKVTTFTASDFGRTFTSNGGGSDHGWGSHHLIVGGAVKGGRIYGRVPDLVVNGPEDTGRGRWIPTTSVDEYSATLARWFGVSPTDMPIVLPNIGRFEKPDLGFMG